VEIIETQAGFNEMSIKFNSELDKFD